MVAERSTWTALAPALRLGKLFPSESSTPDSPKKIGRTCGLVELPKE